MRLGAIAGSVLPLTGPSFGRAVPNEFGTPSSGVAEVPSAEGTLLLISRHGVPPSIPPHAVNYKANVRELVLSGAEAIVSVCSCGALKRELPVPCWAVPDDYIDLCGGHTFVGPEIRHITPTLDQELSGKLLDSCKGTIIEVVRGGTYVQTKGPRLETKAEVRLLSNWGDYVGMNMAPEATLVMEAGLPYSSLLTVDNYAHGIGEGKLDFLDIIESARRSWEDIMNVLKVLANVPPLNRRP